MKGQMMRGVLLIFGLLALSIQHASAQPQRCDIPREARDIWHCENGFVIGPENVIIRLPVPETDPESLYNAGADAAQREDWRVAIAYLTAAQQRAYLIPRYMYNLGLAHARAGHEVAAIAWLSTYLIADPNTSNRAAIWAQIHELETSAQAKIAPLQDRAVAAIPLLPPLRNEYGWNRRTDAYSELARSVARSGDLVRAEALMRQGLQQDSVENSSEAIELSVRYLRDEPIGAAVQDGDLAWGESILDSLAPEDRQRNSYRLDRLRRGEWLWRGGLIPGLGYWPILEGARIPGVSDAQQLLLTQNLDLSGRIESNRVQDGRFAALARVGRGNEALAALPRLIASGYDSREVIAADVGVAFLLGGDVAGATEAARIAWNFARERAAREQSAASSTGWHAARLDALIRAERGDPARAVQSLEIFWSRQLAVWTGNLTGYPVGTPAGTPIDGNFQTFAPARRWAEARQVCTFTIAEYLYHRGRADQAIDLVANGDSLQLQEFLRWVTENGEMRASHSRAAALLAETQNIAGGNTNAPRNDVQHLVEAVVNARTLSGAAYDLDWWLAHVRSDPDPSMQVRGLAWAGEDLARSLRRVHVAYQRAGGTWGQ